MGARASGISWHLTQPCYVHVEKDLCDRATLRRENVRRFDVHTLTQLGNMTGMA